MKQEQLISILQELSTNSKNIKSESDLRILMSKYDMLFVGENCSTINSIELRHSLLKKFKINISQEELNSLIPTACQSLNMKYEAMYDIADSQKLKPNSYLITLW